MKSSVLILFLSIFIFISCSDELTFNAKTKESFEESMNEIKGELTGIESDKLGEAISIFIKYKTTGETDEAKWYQVRQLMHKKTIDEVFELAEITAKENGFAWVRNSAPNKEFALPQAIDTVKLEDPNKPDYNQIKFVKNLKLQVVGSNIDSIQGNDMMYIYPSLVDEYGNVVEFNNLPLKALISIKNNGNLIYTINADFNHSYIGEPSKIRGIKFPYKYLKPSKMKSDLVDIECKVNTPDGYYIANKKDFQVQIPAEISQNSEEQLSDIDRQVTGEIAKETVKQFIVKIGDKDLLTAYNLTRNPNWESFDKFSDKNLGYGAVIATQVLNNQALEVTKNKAKVINQALIEKKKSKLIITTLYTLEQKAGVWYIIDSKVEKVNEVDDNTPKQINNSEEIIVNGTTE